MEIKTNKYSGGRVKPLTEYICPCERGWQ